MKPGFAIRIISGKRGSSIAIRVVPRSNRNEIAEVLEDGSLKIRLMKPPVDDQANKELVKFLSKVLDVTPSDLEIVSGKTSRNKLVNIISLDPNLVEKRLLSFIAQDQNF